MGSVWGDSGGDGVSDADSPGEPDPDELDLVVELVDDEPLPGEGPNAATSDRETIRSGEDWRGSAMARLRQLPRAIRLAGVCAVAAVFALAVWPTSGRREASPRPIPAPSQVNVDLYKVRLRTTTLETEYGADHAVLALSLTNSAATRLEVVSAELWDAVGTRLGSASMWPAQDLGAGTTVSVPVTLPYACDTYGFLPVLPITVRYNISTPQNPDTGHDYAYPLTSSIWDNYMRQRAAQCTSPDAQISASAIDTTQPIGAPSDPEGFDLTFTLESAGTTAWSVDKATVSGSGLTVTGEALPVAVNPGLTARIATHWHVDNCDNPPRWSTQMEVEFTAHATGPPNGGSAAAAQTFIAELRPGLVTAMLYQACGI